MCAWNFLKYPVCLPHEYLTFYKNILVPNWPERLQKVEAIWANVDKDAFVKESKMKDHTEAIKRGRLPYYIEYLRLGREREKTDLTTNEYVSFCYSSLPWSVHRIFVDLHTSTYLHHYYGFLYKKYKEKRSDLQDAISELMTEKTVESSQYIATILRDLHGDTFHPSLLAMVGASIRHVPGVADHCDLVRYSGHSLKDFMFSSEQGDIFFSLVPMSSAKVSNNMWRRAVLDSGLTEVHTHVFQMPPESYNPTANLQQLSSSGDHEFEVIIGPFTSFIAQGAQSFKNSKKKRNFILSHFSFHRKYLRAVNCLECEKEVSRRGSTKKHVSNVHRALLSLYFLEKMLEDKEFCKSFLKNET
jgi:hypothetical protein